jgi:hypothetical protein
MVTEYCNPRTLSPDVDEVVRQNVHLFGEPFNGSLARDALIKVEGDPPQKLHDMRSVVVIGAGASALGEVLEEHPDDRDFVAAAVLRTLGRRGKTLETQLTVLPDGFRKSWREANGRPAEEAVSVAFWVDSHDIQASVGLFDARRGVYYPLPHPAIERWALVGPETKPLVLPRRVFGQLTHNGNKG